MRLWTIQPLDVWETLNREGEVNVNESHTRYNGYRSPAYQWLTAQLGQRLPDYPGTWPWWAYCRFPDLRGYRYTCDKGTAQVRIALEVVSGVEALAFPCWAWSKVFGQQYLAFTRAEHEDWEQRLRHAVPDEDEWPLPDPWRMELAASWERLFAPDIPPRSWDPEVFARQTDYREAVLGTLCLSQVRAITHFTGANRH